MYKLASRYCVHSMHVRCGTCINGSRDARTRVLTGGAGTAERVFLLRVGMHARSCLHRVAMHLVQPPKDSVATVAASEVPPRPQGHSAVRPTTNAEVALADFERDGYCILLNVLTQQEVATYRDHLLGVMGDVRYLNPDGSRIDEATRRYTEPTPQPSSQFLHPADHSRFPVVNKGQGARFHNGDFTRVDGVYGDELRLGIEGYIRHDPRWGQLGCETPIVRAVIDPLLGADFRVVYTDGFVEYPGAKALSWHSDGPHLRFGDHAVDASPRITSLWMLSDFTRFNGGTWVLPGSHKLSLTVQGSAHQGLLENWSSQQKQEFHPDAVAAEAPAGSVLLFDCRLYHTKAPNATDKERLAVQVRYGAQWYYTRLNHSGHAGKGLNPPLPDEVMAELPEDVQPRFSPY